MLFVCLSVCLSLNHAIEGANEKKKILVRIIQRQKKIQNKEK